MHVKMKDKVVLLSGKDKGTTGEVIAIDHAKNRVKVARRNMIVKHKKPNPLTGEEGNRLEIEGWLHASNVALYNEELKGGERVNNRYVGKGGDFFSSKVEAKKSFGDDAPGVIKKVRVGKKSNHVYDAVE
tara:strand:- start:180 stop:569 length:390 start_codon:yes stop_codon:yes gene_type:complete